MKHPQFIRGTRVNRGLPSANHRKSLVLPEDKPPFPVFYAVMAGIAAVLLLITVIAYFRCG